MRMLVTFRPDSSEAERADAVRSVNGWIDSTIPALGVARIALPGDASDAFGDGDAVARILARHPAIASAELDSTMRLSFEPNDQYYRTDPYVSLGQWGIRKAAVDKAWDLARGAPNVIVAILDTGIDPDHPDLAGAIAPGAAFISQPSSGCEAGATKDDNSHGTHVAGIVAAAGNNASGIAGVAFGAKVMALKVLDCTGVGSLSDVANGLVYAVDHGAKVVNLSLGSPFDSSTLRAAVTYATSKNVLVVSAAGNCGTSGDRCTSLHQTEYPAAYPDVISVGATDTDDTVAFFSTKNATVDVSAPGRRILSTTPTYPTYLSRRGSNPSTSTYAVFSGTSQASPFVAGLAALILSAEPSLSASALFERIRSTADDLGEAGRDDGFGTGRVNALRALSVKPATAPVSGARFGATYAPAAAAGSAYEMASTAGIPVTLTNTGATMWPAGGTAPVRLSYHWLQSGRTIVWDGQRAILPADVASGAKVTVTLPVKMPVAPGTYTLRLDLVQEGIAWFSGIGVTPHDLTVNVRSSYVATYTVGAAPPVLLPGGRTTVPVTVVNAGTTTWASSGPTPVRLAAHVTDAKGDAVIWDGARTPFAADLAPGASANVDLIVDAPRAAGPYRVRVDLVREGIAWFSGLGVTTSDVDLLVAADFRASLPGGPITVSRANPVARIAVKNTSIATWTSSGAAPVNIAVHWSDAAGNTLLWDGPRTVLPGAVPPNGTVTVDVRLGAPPAGAAFVTIDLVSEGISWFGAGTLRPVTLAP